MLAEGPDEGTPQQQIVLENDGRRNLISWWQTWTTWSVSESVLWQTLQPRTQKAPSSGMRRGRGPTSAASESRGSPSWASNATCRYPRWPQLLDMWDNRGVHVTHSPPTSPSSSYHHLQQLSCGECGRLHSTHFAPLAL